MKVRLGSKVLTWTYSRWFFFSHENSRESVSIKCGPTREQF